MAAPVLITIPISHFCEKARWALDRACVAFEEQPHVQVIHRFHARRAGSTTVPVLITGDGEVLTESEQILDWADRRAPAGRRLYASDAAAIRAFERRLDEGLGPDGRLWMYFSLRGNRRVAARYGLTGVPDWERRAFPIFYRPMSKVIDLVLGVDRTSADRAEQAVHATFDDVGAMLADGRPYLMGDTFTAADLTFSALAASVLMPPEYGVPLPQPEELPAPMGAKVRELRAHPAGAHALRMFREERR